MELYDRVYVCDPMSSHHRRYGEVVGYIFDTNPHWLQVKLFSDPEDIVRWFSAWQLEPAPADSSVFLP